MREGNPAEENSKEKSAANGHPPDSVRAEAIEIVS